MLTKSIVFSQPIQPIKKGNLYCYELDGIKQVIQQQVKIEQLDSMYSDCQEEAHYWQSGYIKMKESANAKDSSLMLQKQQINEKNLQLEAVQEYSLSLKKQLTRGKRLKTGLIIGGSISIGLNVALLTYIAIKK